MANQPIPEENERALLSLFGTDEDKRRFERIKAGERFMREMFKPRCGCAVEGSCHCRDYVEAERCDSSCGFCPCGGKATY